MPRFGVSRIPVRIPRRVGQAADDRLLLSPLESLGIAGHGHLPVVRTGGPRQYAVATRDGRR